LRKGRKRWGLGEELVWRPSQVRGGSAGRRKKRPFLSGGGDWHNSLGLGIPELPKKKWIVGGWPGRNILITEKDREGGTGKNKIAAVGSGYRKKVSWGGGGIWKGKKTFKKRLGIFFNFWVAIQRPNRNMGNHRWEKKSWGALKFGRGKNGEYGPNVSCNAPGEEERSEV